MAMVLDVLKAALNEMMVSRVECVPQLNEQQNSAAGGRNYIYTAARAQKPGSARPAIWFGIKMKFWGRCF